MKKNTTRRKQLKLDKKRRQKRLERREASVPSLAYDGNKYRKEKFVPIFLAAETAILEVFVVSDRKLTDDDVRQSVTALIEQLRRGPVPALEDLRREPEEGFDLGDFLRWSILTHWHEKFGDGPPLSRDVLVGVLRTTLHSIDVWGASGPRGYLHYLEDFLARLGVEVREATPEECEALDRESSFRPDPLRLGSRR